MATYHKPPTILAQGCSIFLKWDFPEGANRATLDGMNGEFNFFRIQSFTDKLAPQYLLRGEDAIRRYIRFRLRYFHDDRFVCESEAVWNPYCQSNVGNIEFSACESWNGISIGFHDHKIYAMYRLYEVKDGKLELAAESEDFQIASKTFEVGRTYYVEGYMRDKDTKELVVAGVSKWWKLSIDKPKYGKPVVSVVIPCFNIQTFIARLLDSIVMQSLHDIEVVAVDDASTDRTPEILKWYAKKYPFVRILTHEKNEFVTTTRNDGIKAAKCDFVMMPDSDDMLHYDLLRMLYGAMIEKDADIATCRFVERKGFGDYVVNLDRKGDAPVEVFTFEEMQNMRGTHGNIFFVGVWNKMYRKSLMEKVYFLDKEHGYRPRQRYEDNSYTMTICSHTDRIAMVHGTWYMWDKRLRQTTGSLSEPANNEKKTSDAEVWDDWMVSILLAPLRLGGEKNMQLLQYKQLQEVMRNYERLKCWENKSDSQKTILRRFQEGIKEFDLTKNPHVQKDAKMLAAMVKVKTMTV